MEIIKLRETDEFIKLGQALKAAGLVDSGVEAKEVILERMVFVNGEIETRRGKKLYDKREDAAKKDAKRQMDRALKERNV